MITTAQRDPRTLFWIRLVICIGLLTCWTAGTVPGAPSAVHAQHAQPTPEQVAEIAAANLRKAEPPPHFELDPSWPKQPLPNNWGLGIVWGVLPPVVAAGVLVDDEPSGGLADGADDGDSDRPGLRAAGERGSQVGGGNTVTRDHHHMAYSISIHAYKSAIPPEKCRNLSRCFRANAALTRRCQTLGSRRRVAESV